MGPAHARLRWPHAQNLRTRQADGLTLATLAPPPAPAPPRLTPKDAASLIVVDNGLRHPRVLMGRRRADLAFLAGKYVFPGGRVDPADRHTPAADDLDPAVLARLLVRMRGRISPARARGIAIAGVRELREEAGLVIGEPERPALGALMFFARAVTPPGRIRRYDTRFFLADARSLTSDTLGGDGELVDLAWRTLDEVRTLDLPGITRHIIDDLARHFDRHADTPADIPFYYLRAKTLRRDLL